MPYRNDDEAMRAQCQSLRRQLASREAESVDLTRNNEELGATLAAFGRQRISEAERQVASQRLSRNGGLRGAAIALAIVTSALWIINISLWTDEPSTMQADHIEPVEEFPRPAITQMQHSVVQRRSDGSYTVTTHVPSNAVRHSDSP
jgi:hypothetical protein